MVQVTGDHLARDADELDRVFLDQVEASHLGKVLGVDVSAEDFAQAVREHKPQVLGMSALLATTMLGMQDAASLAVRSRLVAAGLSLSLIAASRYLVSTLLPG